jgi:CheY-like chemotaxis protein
VKSKKKILVVDDDTALAKTCTKLLNSFGYDAEAVYCGKDAFTKVKNDNYSIVISDLVISDMDGIELLKKIKLLDNRIDVIMMTSYGTADNAIEAMKLGATDYITKPFRRDELALIVNKILQTKSLNKEVGRLRSELELKHKFGSTISIKNILKNIFYYSGFEYIFRKIKPAKEPRSLPTLPLWLFGAYMAFFLVVSYRYENRVDIIENRAIGIFSQLGTSTRKSALFQFSVLYLRKTLYIQRWLNYYEKPLKIGRENSKMLAL